jgi:uncharacterized RDD family membrane protein YckC
MDRVSAPYFVVFEATSQWTAGKLALGLRVRAESGEIPSLGAVLSRTVFRPIDGFPYLLPNLLGFILLACTPKRQRIGELVSKTVVIDTRRPRDAHRSG